MKVLKVARAMEKVWLVIAVVLAIYGGYKTITVNFESGKMFILMAVVALIWFIVRVKVRKKMEARMDDELEE